LLLSVLVIVGTLALCAVGIVCSSAAVNAATAVIITGIVVVAFGVVLKPSIAKVNAFFLLQTAMCVSIGGAAFYFYTDTPEEYPEGPHFSVVFYSSGMGLLSIICAVFGLYLYQRYAVELSYRATLLVFSLLWTVCSLSDIVLFRRLNLQLGIPDLAMVVGPSVIVGVLRELLYMPAVIIMAQLCPKGMESTIFALLGASRNFGKAVASNVGALMLQWLHCQPSGLPNESRQFDNLWIGAAISCFLSLPPLLLIPWLIPQGRPTDRIDDNDDGDAMAGSLLRRWCGR